MKVEITITCTHTYIPPRCRKPRSEQQHRKACVSIREVSKDSVTPAFRVKEYDHEELTVVSYKGNLYRPVHDRQNRDENRRDVPLWGKVNLENVSWEWRLREYKGQYLTYDEHLALVKKNAKKYIIIDGCLHEKCYEPYYSVTTFGLGRNHGGTGFFVHWANPIQRKLYGWSAIDHQAAIEGAVRIALNRGDTESEEYIRASGNGSIEVLDPAAIRRKYDNPRPF